MAKVKPVTAFLDHCWPAVKPAAVVAEFLTAPVGEEFSDDELKLLQRNKSSRWTAADAVLVDEVVGMLDRLPSFGHIVVDEAQDLSPMQARALARRSSHGSLTVLGDLAQATAPWAARDWRDTLTHLDKEKGTVVPLVTGFRVPGKIIELANRLLPQLGVAVDPAESLRHDGWLDIRESADVASAVAALLEREGSVGVIVADAAAARIRGLLAEDGRLEIMPVSMVKGLEYDHVVVVEPAEIVEAEQRGLHRLYVALTRAVTSLTVLHTRPVAPLF
jgi:superfamily I DNA/RNA helicase